MAYYDTLIAKWATLTGATTDKLAQINALTIPAAPQKSILTPSQILNAIVPADLATLTTTQVAFLTLVLQGSSVDASQGTTVRTAIQTIFTGKTTTLAQLGALVAPFDSPVQSWVTAPIAAGGGGLGGVVTQADLSAAGNLI